MEKKEININKGNKQIKVKKKSKLKALFLVFFGVFLLIFIFGIILKSFGFLNVAETITGIKAENVKKLKKKNGRVNILITGRGGIRNDAPNLTDSIILLSIDVEKKYVTMFSIPRDLYVEFLGRRRGKINEIYVRGLQRGYSKKKAMKLLEEKVEEITGEKINYYANIDFNGFVKIVDSLGGLDIYVPETIYDKRYPKGIGYTTFILTKGHKHISGEIALKYARSRHSTSDFDRSKRQQIIIKALKEKISKLGFLDSVSAIKEFYDTYKKYLDTDLTFKEVASIGLYLKKIPKENFLSFNLNNSCSFGVTRCKAGGFLYTPLKANFGGLSVLLPYTASYKNISNYDEIQKFTNLIFNYPEFFKQKVEIGILNSVGVPGLATLFAGNLKKYGFEINLKNIGNIKDKKYDKTIILYNNIKQDNKVLTILSWFIFTNLEKTETPKYSKNPDTKIEIILGKDYKTYLNYLTN